MRLIDADALKINSWGYRVLVNVTRPTIQVVSFEEIDMAPTIAPESRRKKGKWKAHKPDCRGYASGFICECCGEITYTDYSMKECVYNFCPNCGAKMKEAT